jgi:hypothetical protein
MAEADVSAKDRKRYAVHAYEATRARTILQPSRRRATIPTGIALT